MKTGWQIAIRIDEMERTTVSGSPPAGRSGRPPRELAGAVEARILDAACKVFLSRGFEGASIDEIAETARSGKPTIYARFPNKQALFAAAVTRQLILKKERMASQVPAGASVEERLTSLGVALLTETLTSEWIELIRLAIAETRRFPDLGDSICRTARERGREIMARLLGEVAESGELGTLLVRPEQYVAAARYFIDLILLPFLMRALGGEKLDRLRAEIGPHVSQRVAFFLAACRHGGIG
jgi:AcrR family transcriptional regulator